MPRASMLENDASSSSITATTRACSAASSGKAGASVAIADGTSAAKNPSSAPSICRP